MFSNIITSDKTLQNSFLKAKKYTELFTDFSAPVYAERSDTAGYTIEKTEKGYALKFEKVYDFYAGYLYLCANEEKIKNSKTPVYRKRDIREFGAYYCSSAGGVAKVETLKRFIVALAFFGYTFLEICLDDCVEIEGEPYYGYLRGRYKKEELKEIVAFGKDFEMEIVPAVQTLGHFELILQHPVYGKLADTPEVLLVKEEKSYELIEKIIKTCRECFETERINICFDEAHGIGLGAYLTKHGYENRIDIVLYHLQRVREICAKYSFKPAMWSDMFFRLQFGSYFEPDGVFSKETIEKVPKDIDLIYWDYYRPVEWCYDKILSQHEQLTTRDRIQYAGAVWTFNGFAPVLGFTNQSMLSAISACKKHAIQRFLMTIWGDDCAECSFNCAFANFLMLSEANFNLEIDQASVSSMVKILSGYTYEEWQLLESPNNLFDKYYPTIGNPAKYFLYQDPLMGRYDLYVRDGDKKKFITAGNKLSKLAKRNGYYSFLFENIANLCKVLALKADIGVKVRKAYREKDMESLKAHAKTLKLSAKKLKEFYESFAFSWLKEKKAQGLEIHDARLGGLQNRLLRCAERIEQYANGELLEIEELNEDILFFNPKDGEEDVEYNRAILYQGVYRKLMTVGRL